MFFSMGILQIVMEYLAILLTLLLITYITACLYFCCYKLRNIGASKENKMLCLVEQGWWSEKENNQTVFLVENERQSRRIKEWDHMNTLQSKTNKLSNLMENLEILQKKREILRKLKKRSKDVYNVQKTEKPGEVSLTSYLNFTDKEREIQYDPRNKIPLSIMDKRYQELIEKCKI